MSRKLLLIRHPEARKNLEDRHGGVGSSLTSRGLHQCDILVKYIGSSFQPSGRYVIFGHNVPQVKETVERIANSLQLTTHWDERLRGVDMGKLAGLSRAEAAHQWPEAAERLELWRCGKIHIDKLEMPDGEPIDNFRTRIEGLLDSWLQMQEAETVIVVCTRSVLIMLVNLIELGRNFNYAQYNVYEFDAGGITEVDIADLTPKIVALNQTAYLT